jgi:ferredoxin
MQQSLYQKNSAYFMTHIVTEKCINCKYTTCVTVCPVDCFREGENMLIIDPDICIDCGVCIPECPIDAIVEESDELAKFIIEARELSKTWPITTKAKDPMPEAELYKNEENKYEKYFSPNPFQK